MSSDIQIVLPEILLAVYAMAALIGAVYTGKDRMAAPLTWLTALVMALLAVMIAGGDGAREGLWRHDRR